DRRGSPWFGGRPRPCQLGFRLCSERKVDLPARSGGADYIRLLPSLPTRSRRAAKDRLLSRLVADGSCRFREDNQHSLKRLRPSARAASAVTHHDEPRKLVSPTPQRAARKSSLKTYV